MLNAVLTEIEKNEEDAYQKIKKKKFLFIYLFFMKRNLYVSNFLCFGPYLFAGRNLVFHPE